MNILDIPMRPGNGANAQTLRQYLVAFIYSAFELKRPFGDSGWIFELYDALGDAELLDIERDEDGDVIDLDHKQADDLIKSAIEQLGKNNEL